MTRDDELRQLALVLRKITLAYDEPAIRNDLARIARRCEELADAERETAESGE